MTVLERISQLRLERGWSEYKLSEESGIAQTTISSWFRKNIYPSVPSLEKICNAYNITLSQFFNYNDDFSADLSPQQAELLKNFNRLNKNQQKSLLDFLTTL